jgi:hypothetical protein
MRTLRRLTELHLVTDQDKVRSRARHGDDVGERYLARFVNEQKIHQCVAVFVREHPCCSCVEIAVTRNIDRAADIAHAWAVKESFRVIDGSFFDTLEFDFLFTGELYYLFE